MSDDEDSTPPRDHSRAVSVARSATPREVPVHKLSIPIVMAVSVGMFVVTATLGWAKVQGHADSHTTHLDEASVIAGGGVAYKNEVRELQWKFESGLRRMLQAIKVRCVYTKGSMDSTCTLIVPESE